MEKGWARVGGRYGMNYQFTRGLGLDSVAFQYKSCVKTDKHKQHVF